MFSLFVRIHLSLPDCMFGNACVTADIAFAFLNLRQLLHSRILTEQMSGSTKHRKTVQSHVSVRISGATDRFRIWTKVKLIHTIKIPTDFNSSVCSPSQADHCWHPLTPYLLKQLPPSSSQRGWKWWRQSRWGLLHSHQLGQNASKGHRKCFETSL